MAIKTKLKTVKKKREDRTKNVSNLQQATSSDNTTNRNIILDNADLKLKGNSHWIIGEEDNGDSKRMLGIGSTGDVFLGIIDASTNGVRIRTNNQDRIYINNAGNIGIGTSSPSTKLDIRGRVFVQVNDTPLAIDRISSNGTLISLRQDGIQEGEIRVFGSTVSYIGFAGNHNSSLSTGDSTTNIQRGTILEFIDEKHDNDHPKVRVAKQGSKCVYGVFQEYNENGDIIVTSTGIGKILISGSCEPGDLIISGVNGIGVVQDDDIIRSSTIAKVTTSNSEEGVKLVNCIMLL
ncbi:MAG: hypothetical protein ACOC4B_00485 [Bacteroidota bacterium]